MSESEIKSHSIALVRWVDSTYAAAGWMSIEEAEEWAQKPELVAVTAGILIHDSDTHVVVALSMHPDQVADMMRIPRCAIQSIEILRDFELETGDE